MTIVLPLPDPDKPREHEACCPLCKNYFSFSLLSRRAQISGIYVENRWKMFYEKQHKFNRSELSLSLLYHHHQIVFPTLHSPQTQSLINNTELGHIQSFIYFSFARIFHFHFLWIRICDVQFFLLLSLFSLLNFFFLLIVTLVWNLHAN